jgi:hypothetical protein
MGGFEDFGNSILGIGEKVGDKVLNTGLTALTMPLNMMDMMSKVTKGASDFVSSPFSGLTLIVLIGGGLMVASTVLPAILGSSPQGRMVNMMRY